MTAYSSTQHRIQYTIKLEKSRKLACGYIERYNAGRPLREQLRDSHLTLLGYLMYLQNQAVQSHQAYVGALKEGQPLPLLRTNNVQLAQRLKCSERSIINRRARLKAAGIIRNEVFHGTNSQYEIELSAAVLHLQDRQGPDNHILRFTALQGLQQAQHAPAPLPPGENFSPYSIQKTKLETKELNKLSGAGFQQRADFQAIEWESTVESGGNPVDKEESAVENPQPGYCRDTKQDTGGTGYETAGHEQETPPPVAAAPPIDRRSPGAGSPPADPDSIPPLSPPEQAPETFDEACAGLPAAVKQKIRLHVAGIWITALSELYPDRWLCEQEEERARAVLAEYFIYAQPERFPAGATEIIERIILVKKWIERGRARGERRWVPLPSTYFDFRNKTGFTRTKPWYKKHVEARASIKASELITKAVRQYMRSLEPGAPVGPSETYLRLSQRLGKHGRELLDRFHNQISEIHAATET